MGELRATAVSLRFFGDDLDPESLTSLLGASPTTGVRKGGIWYTSRGFEKRAKTGSWRLQAARRQPGDLDAQIAEVLGALTSDRAIWRELTSRFQGDVFCGLFLESGNDGISLSPQTLVALGERGLTIDLDIYEALADD